MRLNAGVLLIGVCFALSSCGGGGGGGSVPIVASPTLAPTPTPIATTAAGVPAWTSSQHAGYVAIAYGGNPPQHINVYAPGQMVASAILTYAGCCLEQLAFDGQANLLAATTNQGIIAWAPGASASTQILPAQSGFSLAVGPQGDIATGGYNFGPTIAVYPNGNAAAAYRIVAEPAFDGIAISAQGEIAVSQHDGVVRTFARGSTVANRVLTAYPLAGGGVNLNSVAYAPNGDLATGSYVGTSVSVYATGATTAKLTIPVSSVQSLDFDSAGNLVVGENADVRIFPPGSAVASRTISNIVPVALATDAKGNIAIAGWTSPSQILQASGQTVSLTLPDFGANIAISP